MTDKIVVFSTCGTPEEAERLARLLLGARLAACVSVLTQNRSFYWWKDKIEVAAECVLTIKTSRSLFEQVQALIEATHSYGTPEVIALPVVDGAPNYLAWMDAELKSAS